jgi:DNA primase
MAGLIPQAFIDDLLHRTDIVEVIDKRVSLKKTGQNYTACCPFHQEKTPSFSVNHDRQFYYCFGCGVGGNSIGFVMDFDQVDFPQAVETLAGYAGMEVPRDESRAATKKHSENIKLLEVLERASKFYQYQLRQHENKQAAVDYLKSREVSGEIAREFGLGYAPPGWDNLVTAIGTDDKQQKALLKAGLVIEKDRHDSGDGDQPRETDRRYYDRQSIGR